MLSDHKIELNQKSNKEKITIPRYLENKKQTSK